jgi:hypothetical protein
MQIIFDLPGRIIQMLIQGIFYVLDLWGGCCGRNSAIAIGVVLKYNAQMESSGLNLF